MTPGGDLLCVLFQGPEFIQFLQQEYLPSLQVAPEISQVGVALSLSLSRVTWRLQARFDGPEVVSLQELCQVIQQPDVKVLKSYMKV